ncbi:MAG TPA: DUF5063 domain-containing protein [Candidatus Rubrimentiphilum sp.]|nr:DUF5063 domain-containing protein [Candidatus Rubrimentiphilum sp.]
MIDQDDQRWQDFVSAARQCIETIDTASADLVETCAKLHGDLLELQLAAIDLPEVTTDGSDPAMVTEAAHADRNRLKEAFPIRYSMPDQVLELSGAEPPVIREMSEDLADIYDELQDVLALSEARYIDDAVFQARSGYVEDWGFLVVSAQAALWKYVAEAAIDAEDQATPDPDSN